MQPLQSKLFEKEGKRGEKKKNVFDTSTGVAVLSCPVTKNHLSFGPREEIQGAEVISVSSYRDSVTGRKFTPKLSCRAICSASPCLCSGHDSHLLLIFKMQSHFY